MGRNVCHNSGLKNALKSVRARQVTLFIVRSVESHPDQWQSSGQHAGLIAAKMIKIKHIQYPKTLTTYLDGFLGHLGSRLCLGLLLGLLFRSFLGCWDCFLGRLNLLRLWFGGWLELCCLCVELLLCEGYILEGLGSLQSREEMKKKEDKTWEENYNTLLSFLRKHFYAEQ